MAMVAQAGFGLTRVVMLVGAGVAGSVVLRNGRLSEILTEIQEFLEKGEMGKGGGGGADHGINDALNEVRQLAMQVRNLGSPRSITVLSGGSGQTGVSGLIVPAATVGALGYGYMWWKVCFFPSWQLCLCNAHNILTCQKYMIYLLSPLFLLPSLLSYSLRPKM
ncbi:unnamed protein product [Triticum turgidum subsp. durum]|uniref:DUF1664 domain-containing protein n=1 Tax=Triticum turgidum subsp. durum TaxID=4567 RepID=A0A9R0QPF4_TRITD|nr:unnamed protein product [Triticum turgidum subsp. durum]